MKKLRNKNIILLLATILLVIALVITLSVTTLTDHVFVNGHNQFFKNSKLSFGPNNDPKKLKMIHITDNHYCARELLGDSRENLMKLSNSDFVLDKKSDAKEFFAGGAILNACCIKMKEKALKEGLDLIIVSGDTTKDGEWICNMDVANRLRMLQNEIRAKEGFEHFQILVTLGNHDIYNSEYAVKYDKNGKSEKIRTVNYMDFMKIYAGLGFKDFTDDEVEEFENHKDWNTLFSKFIPSKNTKYMDFEYYVDHLANTKKKGYEKDYGVLSYIARYNQAKMQEELGFSKKMTVAILDSFLHVPLKGALDGVEHKTAGQISEKVMQWLESKITDEEKKDPERFALMSCHQNTLEHFNHHEQFLSSFLLHNHENTTLRLSDLGFKYSFTGHTHVHSIAKERLINGRDFVDVSTGAPISMGSPFRILHITKMQHPVTNKNIEKFESRTETIQSLKGIITHNNATDAQLKKEFNSSLYEFDHIDGQGKNTIIHLMCEEIYDNFLYNTIDSYLSERKVRSMVNGKLDNFEYPAFVTDTFLADILPSLKTVKRLLNNALDSFLFAKKYKYKDFNTGTIKDNGSFIDYLANAVKLAVGIDILPDVKGYTINEFAIDVYMAHTLGVYFGTKEEDITLDRVEELCERSAELRVIIDNPSVFCRAIKAVGEIEYMTNLMNKLFSFILEPQFGNKKAIIEELLEAQMKFDIDNLPEKYKPTTPGEEKIYENDKKKIKWLKDEIIAFILDVLGVKIDINNFSINNIIENNRDIPGLNSLFKYASVDYIKGSLKKYANKTFKQNLAYTVKNLVLGMMLGPDTSALEYDQFDLIGDDSTLVLEINCFAEEIVPTSPYTDKYKLYPSLLNIGVDSYDNSSYYFAWMNSRYTEDIRLQYTPEGENKWESAQFIETELRNYPYPLLNVSVFTLTTKYKQEDIDKQFKKKGYNETIKKANFTTARISGLRAGQVYEYRILVKNKYFDNDIVFQRKLRIPGGNKDKTNILAITDIQGSVEQNYRVAEKLLKYVKKNETYDFVIDAGDTVDISENIFHWEYVFDMMSDFFSEEVYVQIKGNHEEKTDTPKFIATQKNNDLKGYYSYKINNIHMICLDTNTLDVNKPSSEQYKFMIQELAKTDCKWKIVLMHKSINIIGNHQKDSEVVANRRVLTRLFADYNVDLVIQGHEHVYTVTQFLDRNGKPINVRKDQDEYTIPNGVLYATIGAAGDKYYDYGLNMEREWLLNKDVSVNRGLDAPTYVMLKIDGDKLTYEGYEYRHNDADPDNPEVNSIGKIVINKKYSGFKSNDADILALDVDGEIIYPNNNTFNIVVAKGTDLTEKISYIQKTDVYPGKITIKGYKVDDLKKKGKTYNIESISEDGSNIKYYKLVVQVN